MVSRINFKELDKLSIKPTGLYGNQSEIIKSLQQAQSLDDNAAALLSRVNKSAESPPSLRSGLYLALHPDHIYRGTSKFAYIIYRPEDTTWDDQAASSSVRRNRVTFMRYLTELAEQTISLVSPSQASAFVWDTSAHNKDLPEDQQENDDDSRLYSFQVSKSLEQEEGAIGSPGFTVSVESRLLPQDAEASRSRVPLVPGEQETVLLAVRHEREQPQEKRFEDTINYTNLRKMIDSKDCPIQLGEDLKPEHLDILVSHGLRSASLVDMMNIYEELNLPVPSGKLLIRSTSKTGLTGISQRLGRRFSTRCECYKTSFTREPTPCFVMPNSASVMTRENRFIPLKDGVWDPDYKRSLLGADVPAIIDALSLGWYESLL
ncbi:unnamed protein product [Rhizoctonia solani]|uniref:Uncharacterized protein n=1 Tax=Rhizoctonia solani TaxID=456999 RepID=A0A8H3CJ07_9AGAM|nr:unnamed protein product [Rhizoctonia solani]